MTTLTITAAEWASVQPDGTLWLARVGVPCLTPRSCPKFTRQMCRWGGTHPPAEFVQACAPCENPTHRIGHKSGLPECRNPSELGPGMHVNTYSFVPCVTCRIELVGPMDRLACGRARCSMGHKAHVWNVQCQDDSPHREDVFCSGYGDGTNYKWPTVTLGHAYAIGQPLPIYGDGNPLRQEPHLYVSKTGVVWFASEQGSVNVTRHFAHYGPPETLVGRWALQLRVVQP